MTAARTRAFTPSREPAEAVDRRTVGRDKILRRIHRTLVAAATSGNRSHVLVVGPRGSGKSHVLRVVESRFGHSEHADRLAFVSVPEDAIGFTRLDDLLELSMRELGDSTDRRGLSSVDRQGRISELLAGRVLVLTIENLDRVMDSLGAAGQRSFRAWVETSGEVLVLATTPLLFSGVQDRDEPWYNAFDPIPLPGLTPEEGHELLELLAADDGDDALLELLRTDRGRDRVRSLAALTGGSPRIWMIMRDCLTPTTLEQLVPAVQDLLEELTPFYQQLLWSLPAQAQRVVRALAEGDSPTMTVAEIAEAAGEPTGISTVLRRLETDRWVERVSSAAPDKRRTFYTLREPLLRHHFQYRSGDSAPLTLVVTFLRIAFDTDERRHGLVDFEPGSPVFTHLAETLRHEPRRSDAAYADRDVNALQAEARLWMADESEWSYAATGRIVDELVSRCRAVEPEDLAEAVGHELAAAKSPDPRTDAHLRLIALCWGRGDAGAIVRDLSSRLAGVADDDLLALVYREEIAFWTGRAGDAELARDLFAELIKARAARLGADHADTLTARRKHAYQIGAILDHVTARDLYADLIPDSERILGTLHRDTLSTRFDHAYETGQAGDHATSRDLFSDLIGDRTYVLGADHADTLVTRHGHAFATAQSGDHTTARDLYATLTEDRTRVLGPDHPDTLNTRHHHAFAVGECGDHTSARDLLATLIDDRVRTYGAHHQHTLTARSAYAYQLWKTGDLARSTIVYETVAEGRAAALGRKHPSTLAARFSHAYLVGQTGDRAAALNLLASLIDDGARTDHPDVDWFRREWVVTLMNLDFAALVRTSLDGQPEAFPDEPTHALARRVALEDVVRRGQPTGVPLADLVIEAKRGSEEALTRLPKELREILDLLPEPGGDPESD